MDFIELLQQQFHDAGYSESSNSLFLIFSKTFPFKDRDGQDNEVSIQVRYEREYPLIPPRLIDVKNVLSSMHSLNGAQCWARFSDIFPQVGLKLIEPSVIEEQINKLIEAHKTVEFYTVNESPEFVATFDFKKAIDHTPFYVNCDVIDKVVESGKGKIIIGVAEYDKYNKAYGVSKLPEAIGAELKFGFVNKLEGSNKRVYFLNVDAILHYDLRINDVEFLCWLERESGISGENVFLQNITDEIYIVVVFYNKHTRNHDIVVLNKAGTKLSLLSHARVSSRNVLFCRHYEEASFLFDKKVALLGIGAIGSVLGMTLLQSGIDKLFILDEDRVDLENTSRSIYCASDVGMYKTDAFKKYAAIKDPDYIQRVEVISSTYEIHKLNPDIIIVCYGDLYEEYRFSREIRKMNLDRAVYVFGQNDCTWAGIYFQDSPELGCQQCLFLHQAENEELTIPYVPYISEAVGCGNPSYVSTPSDIGIIANLSAKLIIQRLNQRQKSGPNFFIWQSNPEPTAWKNSHLERYSLKRYRVDKHAKCEC